MAYLITLFVLASSLSIVVADECDNLLKKFRQPCDCVNLEDGQLSLDCDRVIFPNDLPSLPDSNYSVISYTQKYAGYQSLPLQLFTAPGTSILKNKTIRRQTWCNFCSSTIGTNDSYKIPLIRYDYTVKS